MCLINSCFKLISTIKSKKNGLHPQNNKNKLDTEIDIDEHLLSIEQILKKYQTNLQLGLTELKAKEILLKNGPNILTPPPKTPEFLKFLKQLTSGFALLLWFGSILCLISYSIQHDKDNLFLGLVLAGVCLITGAFAYYQERKSTQIINSFKQLIPHVALVLRDGKFKSIDSKFVVLGDIIEVEGGNQVPADIRIIEAHGCKFDNSSLTGESEPQPRTTSTKNKNPLEADNLAFFSSYCTEGRAKGLVIRTGDKTLIGKIANLSQQSETETTIAKEIRLFILMITIFASTLGTIFFILSLIMGYSFIDAVVFFIGIIVANVPEGLIATVTVCLSLTAKSLSKKNCLVKNLEAVETLGATSIICSDKTGTLTQNRMHVSHVWFNNKSLEIIGNEKILKKLLGKNRFDDFLRVVALCSKVTYEIDSTGKKKYHGDASESAFYKLLENTGLNVNKIRQHHPIIYEIPFNSKNKFHLTVHNLDESTIISTIKKNSGGNNMMKKKYLVCLKGAPEILLKICTSIILDGHCKLMNEQCRQNLNNICIYYASMGERVLAFSEFYLDDYKNLLTIDTNDSQTSLINTLKNLNLSIIGLMSLIDPPRPEVPDAVEKCRLAGIRVLMVTGDHPITAKSIARQVGIISKSNDNIILLDENNYLNEFNLFQQKSQSSTKMNSETHQDDDDEEEEIIEKSLVIPGGILNQFNEKQLDFLIKNFKEIVFARASPQQKLLIVNSCQRLGYIVAVTGDGVNDSPALKKANIGISMGIIGSDVSKQAADMILLDDNFATIVVGIEEGRVIFDNLKKSISYVLASNFTEIMPFLIFAIFGFPLALGTITILCIDLGTDVFPSISLAYEKAESDIMKRRPRNPKRDHLVGLRLFQRSYFQIGMIQAAAGFFTYFCVMADHGFHIWDLFQIRNYWYDKNCLIIHSRDYIHWDYQKRKILEHTCQTAFFASIVVCQWADLIVCKTRLNSVFQQGMDNHVLNLALVFETCLALFLVYCPGMSSIFKLYPLKPWYWFTALPFTFCTFIYDEFRKFLIRNSSNGFFKLETYH